MVALIGDGAVTIISSTEELVVGAILERVGTGGEARAGGDMTVVGGMDM